MIGAVIKAPLSCDAGPAERPLPLPDRNDKRFWSTRARRNRRSEQEAEFSPALCGSWRWHIRRVSDSAAPGGSHRQNAYARTPVA